METIKIVILVLSLSSACLDRTLENINNIVQDRTYFTY